MHCLRLTMLLITIMFALLLSCAPRGASAATLSHPALRCAAVTSPHSPFAVGIAERLPGLDADDGVGLWARLLSVAGCSVAGAACWS
jgi:hypothetical protein